MIAGLAFAAAALAAMGLAGVAPAVAGRLPPAAGRLAALVHVVVRLGREGRTPHAAERRRLLALAALSAVGTGALLVGPLAGVVAGAAAPWALARVLAARRAQYRRSIDRAAPALAVGIADALSGGHSLRSAVSEAARSLDGPAGHELRRVAAELMAGAPTEDALEGMRARVGSERLDALIAACLIQRRAGGDLARLLRDCARLFEEQAQLEDDAKAATAQARFTGVLVVLLPLGGGLLAELASPGWFLGLWGSVLTAWLVGMALVLQLVAAVLMRRLARVRW